MASKHEFNCFHVLRYSFSVYRSMVYITLVLFPTINHLFRKHVYSLSVYVITLLYGQMDKDNLRYQRHLKLYSG